MKVQVMMPNDINPDRLGEIITAERSGRCKVFPCRVGDTVWEVSRKRGAVKPLKVHSFHIFGSRRDMVELVEMGSYTEIHFRRKLYQFGKTLFVSEQEAKNSLSQHACRSSGFAGNIY